ALDGVHGRIEANTDVRLSGGVLEDLPASLWRYPEDVLGTVLVGVLGVGSLGRCRDQPGPMVLEGIRDVLEEHQPEYYVLVLGRVHAAPQNVRRLPEPGLEPEVGSVRGRLRTVCRSPSASCGSHRIGKGSPYGSPTPPEGGSDARLPAQIWSA